MLLASLENYLLNLSSISLRRRGRTAVMKHMKFLQKKILQGFQRFVLYIIAIEINPNRIKITSGFTR
jgi:hypothetical protein